MSPSVHTTISLLVIAIMAAACSSSSSGGGGGSGTAPGSYAERRTSTCLQFQDAFCDFLADRCADLTRAECDDTAQALFCEADTRVQQCIAALETAACGATPPECQVVDPAPAVEFCQEFIGKVCEQIVRCENREYNACVGELSQQIDCRLALGVGPSGDQCLAELESASCASVGELPASCLGVVKLNQ